jgi:hypothetical protein
MIEKISFCKITVIDSMVEIGISQSHENIACPWFWSLYILDLGRDCARLVVYDSFVCLWYVECLGRVCSGHLERYLSIEIPKDMMRNLLLTVWAAK